MKNAIKKIMKFVPTESTLPDGVYQGRWSGHVIDIWYDDHYYELTTELGVKGFAIPVSIEIVNGEATFELVKN